MHNNKVKASPTNDEELIDTLIAISVISKRLANNLRQENEKERKVNTKHEKQRTHERTRYGNCKRSNLY